MQQASGIHLQQLDGVNASALLEREDVGVVPGGVKPRLSGAEDVANGFQKDLVTGRCEAAAAIVSATAARSADDNDSHL